MIRHTGLPGFWMAITSTCLYSGGILLLSSKELYKSSKKIELNHIASGRSVVRWKKSHREFLNPGIAVFMMYFHGFGWDDSWFRNLYLCLIFTSWIETVTYVYLRYWKNDSWYPECDSWCIFIIWNSTIFIRPFFPFRGLDLFLCKNVDLVEYPFVSDHED